MHLPPFTLERFFARFELDVPYMLGSSDCATITLGELLAHEPGAAERLPDLRLGYSESQGSEELRDALAELYPTTGADGIVVHAAAVEAIFVFMNAVLAPGDRVVVLTPRFEPLSVVAREIGCTVERWRARPEAGWAPDLGELRRLLMPAAAPAARLLVVNFPHNPTGFLPDRAFLEEVLCLAEEAGALVFSDEIFRFLEHDPADLLPAVCELSERAVSLGGMSKSFGLAGLRIGWLATRDRATREAVLGFKDYTSTCAGSVAEQLAAIAVRNREAIIAPNRARVVENLGHLRRFIAARPELFSWVPPMAGPVTFPEWLGDGEVVALCERMAREAGVLLIPGKPLGMARHLRFGLGREGFPEGLARLGAALST